MLFSKTLKKWKENNNKEKELVLLERKEKARADTINTALFGFIFGVIGTFLLSGLIYVMVSANQEMLSTSGDTMSTIISLLIAHNLPIFILVFLGLMKMLYMTFNSLWIFLKVIFVKVKDYDLENEPSFRI